MKVPKSVGWRMVDVRWRMVEVDRCQMGGVR